MDKLIEKYFSSLYPAGKNKLVRLEAIYSEWNSKLNLVSRKDMDNFSLHHVLHSLSISRLVNFTPGSLILDAGTGGGLPGIPLAIVFPEVSFTLVDSVRKKINAVKEISATLELKNIEARWSRVEELKDEYDFVVSRAVAPFPALIRLSAGLIKRRSTNTLPNGIIALKGGDLSGELSGCKPCRIINISDFFDEEYFREKKIVYMPLEALPAASL
ncbi:MAG: 16S rRNA (guanine(527)-N(7))-methyltransferase RsmG [Bacteroidales bacterium]|nr:16S rRNA (guanine(527)-N(7))-methyltransferase RsmG [Bacteroidales bacterium]